MEQYFEKYIPSIEPTHILLKDGIEKVAEERKDVTDKIRKFIEGIKPDKDKHIYCMVIAMSSGEVWGPNNNGDYFPEEELFHEGPDQGYNTFLDAGLFQNHKNKDKTMSIKNPIMHRIELIERLDRNLCNRFGRDGIYDRLLDGESIGVSMGVKVPFDECSLCHNKAKTRDDYCDHARYHMNEITPDGRKVYVSNPTLKLFDISFVGKPADENARVTGYVKEKDGAICLGSICVIPKAKLKESEEKTAFLSEYARHSALNIGKAGRDILEIANHPRADDIAGKGTAKHLASSITASISEIASDLYYAAIPPQLHHTKEELSHLKPTMKESFKEGFAPYEKTASSDTKKGKQVKVIAKTSFNSIPIHLEFKPGDMKVGYNRGGKWFKKMECNYGFIPKTIGHDKEEVDVYLNPEAHKESKVYIVKQLKKHNDGFVFDEDKVMLGFPSKEDAHQTYLTHTPAKYFGGIVETSLEKFKEKYLPSIKKHAENNSMDCCISCKTATNKTSDIIKKVPGSMKMLDSSILSKIKRFHPSTNTAN